MLSTLDGSLHAVDAASGVERWVFKTGVPLVSSQLPDEKINKQKEQNFEDISEPVNEPTVDLDDDKLKVDDDRIDEWITEQSKNERRIAETNKHKASSTDGPLLIPGVDGSLYHSSSDGLTKLRTST